MPQNHPHYLAYEEGDHLYLNLVDPDVPLFKAQSFVIFREFARKQWLAGKDLIIHCNQGQSRSPSLALLFLAKDRLVVPNGSYREAAEAFRKLYPYYRPGRGIALFLERNWHSLG